MPSIIGNPAARDAVDRFARELEERRALQHDAGYRMRLRDDKLHTGSGDFVASHPVPRAVFAENKMRERPEIRKRVAAAVYG